ncbi:unnamed protein product [Thelazia callipaeda]|uniref:BZIP domain-containing protein n=1 Tax=Thelazia callipaeda TaxID=103827 RepID=A0A0N5D0M0_THECL|nr:unnamed protein product [Thelazia callipaeda]
MSVDELRKQLQHSQKRENLANLKLTIKEKQLHDLMEENEAMKRNAADENKANCVMVDHAVGMVFTAMREGIRKANKEAKLATLELRGRKHGRESSEVRTLVAMCKRLETEKAELRDEVRRVVRLDTLWNYSKKTVEGLRKRCRDFDSILAERDDEIKRLQMELARLHEENSRLRRNLDRSQASQTQKDDQVSRLNDMGHADVSIVSNENAEEIVSISSHESTHDEMEDDDQVDRVLTPGGSAVEAINVSSPESLHGAPEPETISSDEQDVPDTPSKIHQDFYNL